MRNKLDVEYSIDKDELNTCSLVMDNIKTSIDRQNA
jgi:hypothetical protein